jgi:tetrahydromethanopterin S-methyltransferase subunit F
MPKIRSRCPRCGASIEIPPEARSIICTACGASYLATYSEGSISLASLEETATTGSFDSALSAGVALLATLNEEIDRIKADVESLRSREQGVPLEAGCALFGLFGLVIVVLAVFVTVARSYFGGWLFFLVLGLIVAFALRRMRGRLTTPGQLRALRKRRTELESGLAMMEAESVRVTGILERSIRVQKADSARENGG